MSPVGVAARLRDLSLKAKVTLTLTAVFGSVVTLFLLFLVPFQRDQRERLLQQEQRFVSALRDEHQRVFIHELLGENEESLTVTLASMALQPGVLWVRIESEGLEIAGSADRGVIRELLGTEWELVEGGLSDESGALILRDNGIADVIGVGGRPLLEGRPVSTEALPPCLAGCGLDEPFEEIRWGQRLVLHSAAPLEAAGVEYGRLHVLYSLAALERSAAMTSALFYGLVGTAFVVLVLLLNVLIGRIILAPVTGIREAMTQASTGDLDTRLDVHSKDEIGSIAESFNRMVSELASSKREIEDHSRTLEARVAARTRELGESQADLLRVKNHLATVIANVATGVISLDDDGRVTTFNERAAELLGPKTSRLEGERLDDVLPAEVLAPLVRFLAEAAGSGKGDHFDQLDLKLPRGHRTLSVVASTLESEDGRGTETLLVLDDVTQILATQRLESWKEAVERVIHEIKNPLTPVGLAAQTLRTAYAEDRGRFDEIFESATGMILGSVRDLKQLIAEFTRFSRLPEVEVSRQPLEPLIRGALEPYAHGRDGIELSVSVESKLPEVEVDADQLKRVLINVVNNGVEALEDGGGRLSVRAEVAAGGVVIRVSDDGPGVDDAERIFEPHYTTKVKGTGLGLAIARQVVEEHGGRITADSTPGRGTTVSIELPVAREPPSS